MVSPLRKHSFDKDLSTHNQDEITPTSTSAVTLTASALPSTTTAEGDTEAEIRLYLDKLKEIVPKCPKHRKVSRLELIQHVIDYICDLQQALEERAGLRGADLHFLAQQQLHPSTDSYHKALTQRQPLGVLPLPENTPLLRVRIL